ncbi:hypothetical protein [Pedobacter aquatilis]|uniref:hypothetical protein n=1 Tax=Pedobacter aquatilis TaxID=351343 RepID=UPI00292E1BF9|nr:hypothetical protein [Pedobacter aquatilis]
MKSVNKRLIDIFISKYSKKAAEIGEQVVHKKKAEILKTAKGKKSLLKTSYATILLETKKDGPKLPANK